MAWERGLELRIFVDEGARHGGRPLYLELLERGRRFGLAGGTVWRGLAGYGVHGRLHAATILALGETLPIVVTFVDVPERIEDFVAAIDGLVTEGSLVLTEVRWQRRVRNGSNSAPRH